jgi:hypothetical protein
MWIPHLVLFLIWDKIEKLKHRLRLNSHPSS